MDGFSVLFDFSWDCAASPATRPTQSATTAISTLVTTRSSVI